MSLRDVHVAHHVHAMRLCPIHSISCHGFTPKRAACVPKECRNTCHPRLGRPARSHSVAAGTPSARDRTPCATLALRCGPRRDLSAQRCREAEPWALALQPGNAAPFSCLAILHRTVNLSTVRGSGHDGVPRGFDDIAQWHRLFASSVIG